MVHRFQTAVAHADERGTITDLLMEPIDSVTRITTKAGAVRGNHVHRETHQWTLVLTGRLLMDDGHRRTTVSPGGIVHHPPGDPHAWRAEVDTDCLVFTRGPRASADYESDTYRLDEPLICP